jgi:hypothetical protein
MDSLLTTAGTALAGVALAVVAAFGLASTSDSTPEPVDEPTVMYGER